MTLLPRLLSTLRRSCLANADRIPPPRPPASEHPECS